MGEEILLSSDGFLGSPASCLYTKGFVAKSHAVFFWVIIKREFALIGFRIDDHNILPSANEAIRVKRISSQVETFCLQVPKLYSKKTTSGLWQGYMLS